VSYRPLVLRVSLISYVLYADSGRRINKRFHRLGNLDLVRDLAIGEDVYKVC